MSSSITQNTSDNPSPFVTAGTQEIEKRRALLRKAMFNKPQDTRVRNALVKTLTPSHIRKAANRGVFISYNRADELFALELDNGLREAGVGVWMDAIDVTDDGDWLNEIRSALQRSGIMVVVFSPDSLQDEDLKKELRYFMLAGKIVLPVLHRTCDFDRLSVMIEPVDFRYDMNIGLKRLLYLLKE